jgi:hypothetical protein
MPASQFPVTVAFCLLLASRAPAPGRLLPLGRARSTPLLASNQRFEHPDQLSLLAGRQSRQGMRLRRHPPQQRRPKPRARGRKLQLFYTAILSGRPPLDQPARFETIHEPRHVRRIARERLSETPHGERMSGLYEMEDVTLCGGKLTVVAGRRQVLALREEELHEQLPGAARDVGTMGGTLIASHGVIIAGSIGEMLNS